MRLLNVKTLTFEEFFDKDVPPYGILSHRWTDDEITYKDFVKGNKKDCSGYKKVLAFCDFVQRRKVAGASFIDKQSKTAQDDGVPYLISTAPVHTVRTGCSLEWVWIDTICIDKRSSQELSEAINSMYSWYHEATECYVYLHDVPQTLLTTPGQFELAFKTSSWFTRGWTLQELLAPAILIFCDQTWEIVGHLYKNEKSNRARTLPIELSTPGQPLGRAISAITGIESQFLDDRRQIPLASIAHRLSWAAYRQTTRLEDEAYCLLGLLGVNMPMLYGEGRKAFLRLQEELIKRSDDQSIFAWHLDHPGEARSGILAPTVSAFRQCGNISHDPGTLTAPFAITNAGLHITAPAYKLNGAGTDQGCALFILYLNCSKYIAEQGKRSFPSTPPALCLCPPN